MKRTRYWVNLAIDKWINTVLCFNLHLISDHLGYLFFFSSGFCFVWFLSFNSHSSSNAKAIAWQLYNCLTTFISVKTENHHCSFNTVHLYNFCFQHIFCQTNHISYRLKPLDISTIMSINIPYLSPCNISWCDDD